MRKLQIQDAEMIRLAIQDEIFRSEESRYDHRLHGVLLVCNGMTCSAVAELFGQSRRTVQYWVRRFEESGFSGLRDSFRPGRPPTMTEAIRQAIGIDLRQSPFEFGYSQGLWDGKLLSHHLRERYKVNIGPRQCQRVFHQLGFRLRKPRPLIANADPEQQKQYKKTGSLGAKKRPRSLV